MKIEDTICHRIDASIKHIASGIREGKVNTQFLAEKLHEIRSLATKMENGLQLRKEIMEKAGLEKEYQEKKQKSWIPTGINKLADAEEISYKPLQYEFIVKDKDGKILYQRKVFAGAISVVEKVSDIDEHGIMEGQSQQFFFGHELNQWYAYDQLRIAMEAKRVEFLTTLKATVIAKKFAEPAYKTKILGVLNNRL